MDTDGRQDQSQHNGHNGHLNKLEKDEHAFPTRQLTFLAICRFSEPIAFNSILAYTYVMVKDLNGTEENASFYAGLLVSAYAVAEAMTAMIWGAISDRYGRKPIVLFGLFGVALSSLIFGLAKSYSVALLARFVGGALNGNVAVMQTMVAEMVKNPAHEPKAYAVQPFVWALGSILGSAMGGFLAQPAVFYPSVFSKDGLFGYYPYLLPNLVAVVVIILAVAQGIVFLEETNPIFAEKQHSQPAQHTEEDDETSPLLRISSIQSHTKSIVEGVRDGSRPPFLEEGLPTTMDQKFDLRRSSFGTMHSIRMPHRHDASHDLLNDHRPPPGPKQKTFNFTVIMLTVSIVLISYHQMAFGTILPVYLLDQPNASVGRGGWDLWGGLGYTVHDVGGYMAVNGIIALFIQGVIFPLFVENVGVWWSFITTVVMYPVSYLLMPFLSLLLGREPEWLLPFGIYTTMFLQNFFGIICGPCILILLKNATPSPLVLGKVNGFAMSATCGARTFSPPLVGIIYSKGGSAAAWISCAAVAVIGVVQLWWVPREKAAVEKVEVENALIRDVPVVVLENDAIADDEDEVYAE